MMLTDLSQQAGIPVVTEADVTRVLTIEACIERLTTMFVELHHDEIAIQPRRRVDADGTRFQYIGAWVPSTGLLGLKFSGRPEGSQGHGTIVVFSGETGAIVAAIESRRLSLLRTAAATAVGTQLLAQRDVSVAAVIGTGRIAPLQAAVLPMVRPIQEIRVYGRDAERRRSFAASLAADLDIDVQPCDTAAQAVRDAGVVVTATNAVGPILESDWLMPGAHINVVGSNHPAHREVDGPTVQRAEVVAVDSLASAEEEAGDLILAADEGYFEWDQAVELGAIAAGDAEGRRTRDGMTIFKSVGVAAEDVVAARLVLDAVTSGGAAS